LFAFFNPTIIGSNTCGVGAIAVQDGGENPQQREKQ
jgi:hypothetical protein